MYFAQYHMSDDEVKTMEQMIIDLIFDMAIPFNITERPSFRQFVESIRVNASSKLPDRTNIKESLLTNRAKIAAAPMEELIASALIRGIYLEWFLMAGRILTSCILKV